MTTPASQYEALFNNAAIGIIIVNRNGIVYRANGFACTQFGYLEDELIGQQIEILIPQQFRSRHEQHRTNYHAHNPHNRPMGQGMDLLGLRKDGTEFPVEVSLSVFKNGEEEQVIAFISDITVRKNSEDALRKLNSELEQKVEERTESLRIALGKEKDLGELKSRFVTMASHQFRTPLSTILSSAYLVAQYKERDDQPKRDRHVDRIVSSVNMLTDILNDFLSVGKIEEGKIQVRIGAFKPEEWMNGVLAELRTIAKADQTITYSHSGQSEANIDSGLLKHIVLNLASNAIKFSPQGSTIHIATTIDDAGFSLSVKDAGIGISAADREQLFQRFFRGTNATNIEGTGLGLHIVAKYAELMGGTVACISEPEQGSTFTVLFPALTTITDDGNSTTD